MKERLYLVSAVFAAILWVVVLTVGISRVQAGDRSDQVSPGPSSDPLPVGATIDSPSGDVVGNSQPDADILATYDSYLRISGAALKPRESNVEWRGVSGRGGCVYAESGNEEAVFNTPVYLPQGSVVKFLRMYVNDTHETIDSTAWFSVYDLYGVLVEEHDVSSSGISGTGYATTLEFTTTVNYDAHSYMVNWRPKVIGDVMQICGFRIYYQAPFGTTSYMPVILNDSD